MGFSAQVECWEMREKPGSISTEAADMEEER